MSDYPRAMSGGRRVRDFLFDDNIRGIVYLCNSNIRRAPAIWIQPHEWDPRIGHLLEDLVGLHN